MTQHNNTTQAPKAVLRRVSNDIIVLKTPIVKDYTSILQVIGNNTDEIILTDNEIGSLILVLQEYKEQLRNYTE